MSVQVVNLPEGVVISSRGRRFLAMLLDFGLAIITLGIGWFIWSMFTFQTGQTPAKKIMGMRLMHMYTQESLGWGRTFVREFVIKGYIAYVTLGLAYLWILWDEKNQSLYDKVMSVLVVDDSNGATLAGGNVPSQPFQPMQPSPPPPPQSF